MKFLFNVKNGVKISKFYKFNFFPSMSINQMYKCYNNRSTRVKEVEFFLSKKIGENITILLSKEGKIGRFVQNFK